jgi:hypothetical protein
VRVHSCPRARRYWLRSGVDDNVQLTLVQSAVVASREAYLSQQAAIRARLAQQEGLVSVDAESVVSPWLGFAATPDSDAAGRAPPAEKRRERERSKTDSSSDKATEAEAAEEDEDEEDEIERLLRRSRSTRRFGTPSVLLGEQQQQQQQQHHHRHKVSWSDVPVPAHEHIPLAPIPLSYQPIYRSGAVESADDLNEEEDDEIEISDGVRSCRLFTLASLEEEEEANDQIGTATEELPYPDPDPAKVFATEPEFASSASSAAADNAPRSLASFEIPPHPSVSSSSSNSKKAGKGAFRRGGGGGGKGKGVGLGKQVEIRGMILVEGTYDIVRQAKWEHDCGMEEGELWRRRDYYKVQWTLRRPRSCDST